jgi:PAS domain-containing protein
MQGREQAQQTLQESEQHYRQLLEICPDAIFIHCGGQFVFLNSATVKLYGATSSEELIGRPVLERVHPDYQEIKCVDLHRGQITVDSVVDVGTSFSVTLPLNSPVCPSDSPNPHQCSISNAEKPIAKR